LELRDELELKRLPGDGISRADTLGVGTRLGGDSATGLGGEGFGGDVRHSGVNTGMPLARVGILGGFAEGTLGGGMWTSIAARSFGDGLGVTISSTLH
jgi:hypothetical protein